MTDPAPLDLDLQCALVAYLLPWADDELILGHRDSEWTGFAPMLEEDLAFSSIAQDEIGHAALIYGLIGAFTGDSPDLLALDRPEADGQVFNVGSGADRTVEEVARLQAAAMGRPDLKPEVTGKARAGDIRHCIPDLTKARTMLGYAAQEDFSEGLAELAEWVARQEAEDRVIEARKELEMRGLVA